MHDVATMSPRDRPAAGLSWWKWLLLPGMAAVIVGCYFWAPDLTNFPGDAVTPRIIFWHVPMAMLSMLWFGVCAFYAARLLAGSDPFDDERSARAAEIGLLVTVLATLTGMVFSKMQWGGGFRTPWYHGYWQWDPQQTAITVVMIIFAAYFGLRASVDEPRRRARLSAAYAVLAGLAVPFCYYVLPRLPIFGSLSHPTGEVLFRQNGGMSVEYRTIFWLSVAVFFGVTLWMYHLRLRAERAAARRIEDAADEPLVRAWRPISPNGREENVAEPTAPAGRER